MSRSVSAPSLVTKTSPCWNGFIVPGSTLRYGSSFCIVTRRPRALRRLPRLDAVRPFPSEEATPPVTNTCLVGVPLITELHPTAEMRAARSRRTGLGQGNCSVRARRTERAALHAERPDQCERRGHATERGLHAVDRRCVLGRRLGAEPPEIARGRGGAAAPGDHDAGRPG